MFDIFKNKEKEAVPQESRDTAKEIPKTDFHWEADNDQVGHITVDTRPVNGQYEMMIEINGQEEVINFGPHFNLKENPICIKSAKFIHDWASELINHNELSKDLILKKINEELEKYNN